MDGGAAIGGRALAIEGFAIFGAPIGWALQLTIGYALTGYACHPRHLWLIDVPSGWTWARPLALATNLAALAVGGAGGWASWSLWRGVVSGTTHRRRFSALCGLLSSAVFFAADLCNTAPLLAAPTC